MFAWIGICIILPPFILLGICAFIAFGGTSSTSVPEPEPEHIPDAWEKYYEAQERKVTGEGYTRTEWKA